MPTHSGPNIVDNGLVLSLDAADNNSFRGEPTTNLVTNTPSQNGWAGTYSLVDSSSKTFTIKTQQNNSNNTSAWRTWYWDVSSYVGSYITISGDIEFVEESNATFLHVSIGQGNTGSFPYHIAGSGTSDRVQISTKPIQKISVSWSGVINATGIVGFTQWIDNVTANGAYSILKVSNILIEAKSYKTRFVNGTRGTTVATGGGWKDLSGNNNHGEIVNGVTTSNDQTPQGALEFDGVDDYIDLTLNNPSGDWVHSIVFWMMLSDNQSNISTRVDPFQIGNSNLQSQYSAMDISNGNVNWYFYSNDTRIQSNIFSANNWYHISLTYSGGGATISNKNIYINGLYRDWDITTGNNYGDSLNIATNAQMSIGRDGIRNTAYFPGYISLFKIYNRALTATEIQQNYNSQKSRFGL